MSQDVFRIARIKPPIAAPAKRVHAADATARRSVGAMTQVGDVIAVTHSWCYANWLRRLVKFPGDLGVIVATAALVLLASRLWPRSGDIALYTHDAQRFLAAGHFPQEYPPLAMVIFLLPGLSPAHPYLLFGGAMLGAVVLAYLVATHYTARFPALLMALYTLMGDMPMVVGRFDVVPALLTLFALYMARAQQWQRSYLLLTIGLLLKLYPLFLIPVVLIAHWQALRDVPIIARMQAVARGMALALMVGGVVVSCAIWLSPTTALHFLTFATRRPTQIEAVGGTFIWLDAILRGNLPTIVASYGSHNYAGAASMLFAASSPYLMLLGLGCVYLRQYRGAITVSQAFLLSIGVIVMTSKVFSTQYLLWLLPFVGEVEGISLLWAAICLTTALDGLYYPYLLHQLASTDDIQHFLALVALRNVLFIVAMARCFWGHEHVWAA